MGNVLNMRKPEVDGEEMGHSKHTWEPQFQSWPGQLKCYFKEVLGISILQLLLFIPCFFQDSALMSLPPGSLP